MRFIFLGNAYSLIFISSVLLILSFPPFNYSFLIWFALAPFLYAVLTHPSKREKLWVFTYNKPYILGLLLGMIFYFGTLYWLTGIFKAAAFLLLLILCLYTAFYGYILNMLHDKTKNWLLRLLLPAVLWVAIEFFKSEGWWMKFTWMNLGYSQHNMLPFLQIASVIGQYGISFAIVLVNTLIAYSIMHRHRLRSAARYMAGAALIISSLLLFGYTQMKDYTTDVSVGLVQDESSDFERYRALTESISHAAIIVWPEYSVPKYLNEEPLLMYQLSQAAQLNDNYLILGGKDKVNGGYYNTAFIFYPDGNVSTYHKMNPIQFFNDGLPGKEFAVHETIYGKIGVLICYDMDYSYVARNIVRNGAEALFIPTYDAMRWSRLQHQQHSAMTSMRAVETGRFIARAASSGISQVVDPNGRITTEIAFGLSDSAVGKIAFRDDKTFYVRIGYLFPFACIFITLMMIISVFFKKTAAKLL